MSDDQLFAEPVSHPADFWPSKSVWNKMAKTTERISELCPRCSTNWTVECMEMRVSTPGFDNVPHRGMSMWCCRLCGPSCAEVIRQVFGTVDVVEKVRP